MTWRNEWSAIASRIDSLLSAGHFLIQALGINSSDSYKVADKLLGKEAQQVVSSLRRFLEAHCDAIPPAAAAGLKEFLDNYGKAIEDQSLKGLDGLKLRVTALQNNMTDRLNAKRNAIRLKIEQKRTGVAHEIMRFLS